MKIGAFSIKDYMERLTEEKEASSKVPVEGLIIPDENKKSFAWLKKEFQKGKAEVKVEMKMGGQKFEPGYDLQTNLKSVNDFKPGMFGDAKTSDAVDGKKKEEGQNVENKPDDKEMGKAIPGKKEHKGVVVKSAKTEKKDEYENKEHEENKEKGGFKPFKKKLHEGLEIRQEGTQDLEPEVLAYLDNLPFTRKPDINDLYYAKKIEVDPQLEAILSLLPIVDFDTYEDLLEDYGEDFPYKRFFIANIKEDDGVSFLVRPEGYPYARYLAELI
jgi:hypothetical protein